MPHPLMDSPEMRRLSGRCREAGVALQFLREIQSGIQLRAERRGEQITINVYGGKRGVRVVFQGSGLLRDELAEEEPRPESPWRVWIGSDESGKGDFFGPLVVAGVRVEAAQALELSAWGVKDSKVLSPSRILQLERRIREACETSVVRLDPPEYNRVYKKIENVNTILGEAHARVIEEILEKRPDAEAAIADQFGDESYIRDALQARAKKIKLIQRPRAESDPAVAAASIVARAGFVRGLEALSKEFDFDFPKGAGAEVVRAAREFAERRGRRELSRVAKTHFKTLDQI